MDSSHTSHAFSRLLKFWRGVHKISQEALALRLDSSARHISFLENGRAHPSKEMVEKIANELKLGSRDKSHLMVSAGYIPPSETVDFQSDEMKWLRNAMIMTLKSLDPYPATLSGAYGKILMVNKGWVGFFRQSHTQEQLNAVTNHFEFMFDRMGGEELTESWKNTLSVVLMSLTQNVLMADEDYPAIWHRLTSHPDLPADWQQRAAQLEPMASYRVQISMQGQLRNFYNISQSVGATGPNAYVSEPHLFTTTLYPEDQSDDLSGLVTDDLTHPLLFY